MKKLTYAIALCSLLLASCSQDEGIMENKGELVTLNYNVTLGNQSQSRATQDLAVNKLLCVIFESATGNKVKRDMVDMNAEGKFIYSPKLFSNIEYKIAFWAYYADAEGMSCFNLSDVKAITTNGNYDNDNGNFIENKYKDAYTACHEVDMAEKNQKITLTRPFGMVNIYTSQADFEAAKEMGSTPTSGTLTIGNCSKTFDAYNQQWLTTIDGAIELNTSVSATPVRYNNIDCINLASEYVFGNGTVATTQISVIDNNKNEIYKSSIENMPLVVNTRTNLYNENLFTGGGVTYTIEISQGFYGDIHESVN